MTGTHTRQAPYSWRQTNGGRIELTIFSCCMHTTALQAVSLSSWIHCALLTCALGALVDVVALYSGPGLHLNIKRR